MITRSGKSYNIENSINTYPVNTHLTRSGKSYNKENSINTYPVNIDFNKAQKEWNKNKIKLPNGCYKYK